MIHEGKQKAFERSLKDIRHDMTDEEVLNLLADSKISENPQAKKEKYTLVSGRRTPLRNLRELGVHLLLHRRADPCGWWSTPAGGKAFDPYPFILLNLVLSCVAAIRRR